MIRRVILLVIFGLLFTSSAANANQWPEEYRDREILVGEIKTYTKDNLGFTPTGSFVEYAKGGSSYTNCFRAPIFAVVDRDSSGAVDYRTDGECRPAAVDVWDAYSRVIYAYANPGSDTAMNPTLVETELERFVESILHEEFHDQTWGFKGDSSVLEGTATIVGLAGASVFICNRLGDSSKECDKAHSVFISAINMASRIKTLADELRRLYDDVDNGVVTREDGLLMKAEIFTSFTNAWRVERSKYGLTREWPGIYTNAGLSDYLPYNEYLPLLYELYLAFDENIGTMSKYLIALSRGDKDGNEVISGIEAKIAELVNEGL